MIVCDNVRDDKCLNGNVDVRVVSHVPFRVKRTEKLYGHVGHLRQFQSRSYRFFLITCDDVTIRDGVVHHTTHIWMLG